MKRHRSVLNRLERVRILEEKGTLSLESSSLLGLPKVKHLRIRVRKEKAAGPAAGAATGTGAAAVSSGAAAATSPAAGKAAPKTVSAKAGAGSSKPEAAAQPKKKE